MSATSSSRTALIGFASALLIMVCSTARSWPFPTLTAEPWIFQFTPGNDAIKWLMFVGFVAGVAGLCWAWVRAIKHANRDEISVRRTWAMFVLWAIPIAVSVPLFSGDVYVYYVDGEAYIRGFNIYENGVAAMGPDAMVHMVHPLWQETRTMYGPLFMRFGQGIAWLANGNVIAGVIMMRVAVIASVVLLGAAAVKLAKVFGRKPAEALAFALLNPLVLMHFVGGSHNDAIMVGLMAAGFAVGIKAKSIPMRFIALLLCAVAASIKLPAFAAVLVLGWIWGGAVVETWGRRVIGGVITGVSGIVLFQLITMSTGLGWGWVNALDVPGLAHPMVAPANALAFAVGGVFGVPLGVNEVTRLLFNAGSVVLAVFFVLRLGKHATPQQVMRATGWALFALGWMGPSVYAWYMGWGLALLAITGALKMQKALITAVIVLSFTILPGSYGLFDEWSDWRKTVLAFAVCAAYVWGIAKVLEINGVTSMTVRNSASTALSVVKKTLSGRKKPNSRNGQVYPRSTAGTSNS